MIFDTYETDGFFDEMLSEPGVPREGMDWIVEKFASIENQDLLRWQRSAERTLADLGITFTLKTDDGDTERIFPFDLIPRIISAQEWCWIEAGLRQRIHALNLFIDDVYHEQQILKDRVVPREVVLQSPGFRRECIGLRPPKGIWCHVTGTDLVRNSDGQIHVLEDNMRCPSGVSYVLENREIMKRTMPNFFKNIRVRPVEEYPSRLLRMLQYLAPEGRENPEVAVLTPGCYNSAYFEHSFLAMQMGVELVEGRDLLVEDGYVKMRTTRGLERVDVIYRRIDDDFLDPLTFRPDSMLGVPGLMDVYMAGRVALANAPGTGVADDKVIYAYVPQIIEYYLGEDAIIPNVPTYLCGDPKQREFVIQHLTELVVKPANESGGAGIMVGPHASASQREECRLRIEGNPRNFVAQPTLSLSRVPTICGEGFEGRHVDLRPYALFDDDVYVLPGALTRVALKKGSLVVNSSQGGGSKDTWVLAE